MSSPTISSWWETLQSVVALRIDGDVAPVWDTVENGTLVRDFWFGYDHLRFLVPDDVQQFLATLQAISESSLHRRFMHAWADYDLDDEEKERFFRGLLDCDQTLTKFVREAQLNHEALVWYIA